jgi:GH15 family glucan-1,4-alpha-glucosidase
LVATDAQPVRVPSPDEVRGRIDVTAGTWRRWSDTIGYEGPWRDAVTRSAIALKSLIGGQSGAMAAAATTSLPEKVGGERNYDYRYVWIRDASFALDALGRLGLLEEVHHVLCWLLAAVANTAPDLHVFYALSGEPARPAMHEVAGAAGWRGSEPVHVGNSAASQTQLGCYGDLLDAVVQYTGRGGYLDGATAAMVAELADRCCDLWHRPDAGFWELGAYEHYTISKIGCWVALDRACKLAAAGQLASTHARRWRDEADAIHAWVDQHCWSATKQSYSFYAGTDELDAAVLLAARTGFCPADDTRLAGTIDAVRAELGAGGSLLYRYSGQQAKEGAFLACSCWVVEALAYVGRASEARELLDEFVARRSDVGLYSEEMDPATGELLGNLPQALTHLALIGAATALARATGP